MYDGIVEHTGVEFLLCLLVDLLGEIQGGGLEIVGLHRGHRHPHRTPVLVDDSLSSSHSAQTAVVGLGDELDGDVFCGVHAVDSEALCP